jgi:ribosomal protein S18 acetylase RimI-like enzyme
MLYPTVVTDKNDLLQIYELNQQNIRDHVAPEEQAREGFVSWLYPPELLQKMHELAASVIVKDDDMVVGYALTTLRDASGFHPDLETMFRNLQSIYYKGQLLFSYRFYCMGQICVAKAYRGKGLVDMLYRKHKEIYSGQYDFILTEISTRNLRSIKAHERIGFKSVYSYRDAMDEWAVVIWDWK